MQFSDNGPLDEDKAAEWFQRQLTDNHERHLPESRAIELKATKQTIGYVTISDAAKRSQSGDVELGIRLAPGYWGQGYASEAARCMIELALRNKDVHRVIGIVDPANMRSVHLLQKLGMRFGRAIEFDGYDHPDHLYVIER